ncbi:MAG: hypothetical protein JNK82_31650 [Myxococcaceae bacterium]|nr:hypothetical protein [Myxococcaceae bacterium]
MNRLALLGFLVASTCKPPPPQPGQLPSATDDCHAIEASNLEAVVECFYRAQDARAQYRLFSTAAKAELPESEWVASMNPATQAVSDVRVTQRETIQGSAYAAVSRVRRHVLVDGGLSCSDTSTRTWIREGNGWRMHGGFDRIAEVAAKKFDSGDYSGAAEASEEWLRVDPFSVDAYDKLGFAVLRGARGKAAADIVRAALAIDASNSKALLLAVSLSTDPDVAESYLKRFRPDDCVLPTAVANVAASFVVDAGRPKEALALIDRYATTDRDGRFALIRIRALNVLRRQKEAAALLTKAAAQDIRRHLDTQDPSYAAEQAAAVASTLLEAERPTAAREWVDYGLMKDPSNANLARLLRLARN